MPTETTLPAHLQSFTRLLLKNQVGVKFIVRQQLSDADVDLSLGEQLLQVCDVIVFGDGGCRVR